MIIEETVEIYKVHKKEGRFGKSDTHWEDWGHERQRGKQRITYLAILNKWMSTRFGGINKSNEEQDVVESHDYFRLQGTRTRISVFYGGH